MTAGPGRGADTLNSSIQEAETGGKRVKASLSSIVKPCLKKEKEKEEKESRRLVLGV